jgi:hypothetical protein
MPESLEIRLEHTSRYQTTATQVAELKAKRLGLEKIAHHLDMTEEMTRAASKFAETGRLHTWKRGPQSGQALEPSRPPTGDLAPRPGGFATRC